MGQEARTFGTLPSLRGRFGIVNVLGLDEPDQVEYSRTIIPLLPRRRNGPPQGSWETSQAV
jgi:hypothetical protein